MPYLDFRVSAKPSQQQAERVAGILTELTATVLGKKPELTSVSIHAMEAGHWYIGGNSLASQSLVTFYLDIKVTEGTNTKNEKAEYVRRVFAAVADIFGALAPASYVVIDEVHADAWGYQGQTQEYRYIRGKPL
ncbi:tautomerase family protein [Pseudoxanthomonas dokdonensis]|uniref:4-oxalocrotonate tautomerase-like domain-containing protein n=1 Tax=Pseudoxanthomonas dokdonensis TaxID=344882 RepID=A0A0R0CVL8_9GAMM|nr:tautomerase family protein [Pseudoxanthomonas dokdonensis]KRG69793.1 hypothetical protein ABB29_08330 [Pseudoxanthomonas dokdonensis]